jgi:uncharacterized protein with NRDE domain
VVSLAHRCGHASISPKVQIVDRPLLVSHVYVEGEEIQRWLCCATQHFEERREAVARERGTRAATVLRVRHDDGQPGGVYCGYDRRTTIAGVG